MSRVYMVTLSDRLSECVEELLDDGTSTFSNIVASALSAWILDMQKYSPMFGDAFPKTMDYER